MNRKAKTEKVVVSKSRIIRSVASSTAIETGEAIDVIEKRLRENKGRFKHLSLAK